MSLSDILHRGEKNLLHSSMSVGRLPKRRIATFDGTNYGTLDTPITFADDFEVDIEYASTDTSATARGLFGDSTGGVINYFQPNDGSGKCNFKTDDGIVSWTHLNEHLDGKIYTLTAYRSGLTIGIKLDGVIKASLLLGAASTVDIDLLGALGINSVVSQQFNGQLLSAKFTDAGTVVADFVFDAGSTTDQPSRGGSNNITLVNFTAANWNRYTLQRNIAHDAGVIGGAWVGDNLVVNGGFDTDTDWVLGAEWSISGGKLNRAVAAATSTSQASIIHQSSPHILKYNVDKVGGDNSSVFLGGALFKDTPDSGDFIILNTVGTSANIALLTDANFEGSFDNISVQHILEVA